MGIDIYARWKGQSPSERQEQEGVWLSTISGSKGYLREAYHGDRYATRFLCAEAFETENGARIPAKTLRERLPLALVIAEKRERALYKASDSEVAEVKQSYRDFVDLCGRKEKEAGEPVLIFASW